MQALGILSLIVAVLGMACSVYGWLGDSKGDRARLLPYISGGICLAAGNVKIYRFELMTHIYVYLGKHIHTF